MCIIITSLNKHTLEQTEINTLHFEQSVNKDISIMTFNNHQNLSKQNHTWQEEDYNHRVDNWEPVNLDITHGKVCVPPWCPLHLTRLHRGKTRLSSSSLSLFNIHYNWIFENNKNSLNCVDFKTFRIQKYQLEIKAHRKDVCNRYAGASG